MTNGFCAYFDCAKDARGMTKFGFPGTSGMTGEGCQRTETPLPYQHRHTARSRSIHSGVPRPLASPATALASKDGFRDCARNDEVWVRAGTSGMTGEGCQRRLCPTNTVILREVAVSIVECQGRWLLRLLRWQAKMDSATARGMTKFGFCAYFGNDRRRMPEE